MEIKILIAEHDSNDLELLQYELKKSGIKYVSEIVQNEQDYRHALLNFIPDIILSDYSFPSFHGLAAFQVRESLAPNTPFIIVSGTIGEEKAVELIKSGVTDFAQKDKLFTLPQKITRALKDANEKQLRTKAEEKLNKANHLYAFMSQVNQKIVHEQDEEALFRNSCRIAIEFGKFKIAWIGLFDTTQKKINLVGQSGILEEDMKQFAHATYQHNGPQDYVLRTCTSYICNDIQQELELEDWKPFAAKYGIRSCMVLPIQKSGVIIGTFNLYSTQLNFSDKEEIAMLVEVTGDISFALDIFEKVKRHKETEELIVKNETRFRALIEKSTDMKSLLTQDGKLMYGSPSIKKILGYSMKEYLQSSAFDIIHPDDCELFKHDIQEILLTQGKSFHREQRLRHRNGSWVWCEGTVTNMLHEPGICALVSNFWDVSDKKIAEQQRQVIIKELKQNERWLRKSEAFSRGVLNSLSSHIAVVDGVGTIVAVNNSWIRHALENGDANLESTGQGANYFDVCEKSAKSGDKIAAEVLVGMMDVMEEKRGVFYIEYPCHTPAKHQWFAMRVMKFQSDEPMVVVAHMDISERKLVEEKLIHKNIELLKTNEELDRFVYSTSHDLRSPLSSILGLVHLIDIESTEIKTLEYANLIRCSINRLDEFIKNILNYSRNKRTELEVREIPLQKTVDEIVNSLCNMKEAEGINIEVDMQEQEPFYSDVRRFKIVIENMISNAIKYHKKDISGRYIKVKGQSDKDNLHICIEDNGMGIPSEYHNKIFEMFYRLSTDSTGSGIGLYIVKETIDKLHGSIVVCSEEGVGTTFSITLKNMY